MRLVCLPHYAKQYAQLFYLAKEGTGLSLCLILQSGSLFIMGPNANSVNLSEAILKHRIKDEKNITNISNYNQPL